MRDHSRRTKMYGRLSWNCRWKWRMSAMARNRPWQTCWRTRATPSMCQPAACPLVKRPQPAAQRWGPWNRLVIPPCRRKRPRKPKKNARPMQRKHLSGLCLRELNTLLFRVFVGRAYSLSPRSCGRAGGKKQKIELVGFRSVVSLRFAALEIDNMCRCQPAAIMWIVAGACYSRFFCDSTSSRWASSTFQPCT